MSAIDELLMRLRRFASGEAHLLTDANAIEAACYELSEEHPVLEDLALEFAAYRPEGGEYLYDFAQMKPRVEGCIRVLEQARRAES